MFFRHCFFRRTGQIFGRMSSYWDLSDAFLKVRLGLWAVGRKTTGEKGHFLLQEIFPTQGSNPGLLHCRQILYCLSYQGSPNNLRRDSILREGSRTPSP